MQCKKTKENSLSRRQRGSFVCKQQHSILPHIPGWPLTLTDTRTQEPRAPSRSNKATVVVARVLEVATKCWQPSPRHGLKHVAPPYLPGAHHRLTRMVEDEDVIRTAERTRMSRTMGSLAPVFSPPPRPPQPRPAPASPPRHSRKGLAMVTVVVFTFLGAGRGHIREGRRGPPLLDEPEPTLPSPPPPQLDPAHSADVTALAGRPAILNCRVHNINNKTVSWIRHRDIHLLTVGRYTYTSDQRFRARHEDDADDWILMINYVQTRDSGVYECQVSTTPPISHFIRLTVVKPYTHILGGPDMHINTGSTINLTCLVEYSPKPPDFLYWNHNNKIISYDSSRGGVTVILEKGDLTTSSLLIQKARPSDSGRYDCSPSNADSANVTVHVLNGKHPAAMQHGGHSTYTNSSLGNIVCLLVLLAGLHATLKTS